MADYIHNGDNLPLADQRRVVYPQVHQASFIANNIIAGGVWITPRDFQFEPDTNRKWLLWDKCVLGWRIVMAAGGGSLQVWLSSQSGGLGIWDEALWRVFPLVGGGFVNTESGLELPALCASFLIVPTTPLDDAQGMIIARGL